MIVKTFAWQDEAATAAFATRLAQHWRAQPQDADMLIFLHGDLVFFYLEYSGSDYGADMAALGKTEVMQRWWTHTHPCFERFAVEPDCEFTPEMKQVFFCL